MRRILPPASVPVGHPLMPLGTAPGAGLPGLCSHEIARFSTQRSRPHGSAGTAHVRRAHGAAVVRVAPRAVAGSGASCPPRLFGGRAQSGPAARLCRPPSYAYIPAGPASRGRASWTDGAADGPQKWAVRRGRTRVGAAGQRVSAAAAARARGLPLGAPARRLDRRLALLTSPAVEARAGVRICATGWRSCSPHDAAGESTTRCGAAAYDPCKSLTTRPAGGTVDPNYGASAGRGPGPGSVTSRCEVSRGRRSRARTPRQRSAADRPRAASISAAARDPGRDATPP